MIQPSLHRFRRVLQNSLGAAARFSPIKTTRFGYPNRILEQASWIASQTVAQRPAYVKDVRFLAERGIRRVSSAKRIRATDSLLWEWTQDWKPRPRYVVTLNDARVSENAVIAPDHAILWELSFLWNVKPGQHPLLRTPLLPAAVHLPGRSLFLGVDSADNYFHWLLDLLPKLKVLKDGGWDYLSFDHYLVNSQKHEFQRESLRRLGIPTEKIVVTSRHRHLTTETLVAPSWAEQSGIFEREDLDWLRGFLLAPERNQPSPLPKRFFISRKKTRGRNISNDAAFQAVLQKHGVTAVVLESLSFDEQIRLFQGAELILAVHGAGLTNLLFCQPGTKVIELVSPEWAVQMYYYLAAVLGLDHNYLVGTAVAGADPVFQDLRVDAEVIDQQLAAWSGD